MTQSRRMSLFEAVANVAVGYGIAVLVQITLFPLFGLEVDLGANLVIGGVFTAVSIARSYLLRRTFERARARKVARQQAMAIRGRKPKPTRIKRLHGNPGRRPLNAGEPIPEPAIPSPPDFLSDEAKLEWSRVSEQLFRLGLLSQLDRTSLAAYCQAYARWKQAENAIAELAKRDQLSHGLMIKTSNGNLIQNPLVGTANKAMSEMMRYAVEFGMTPSARSRVDAGVSFDGGKFAGLLGPRDDRAERHFRDIDRPGALVDFIASNPSNRRPQ